MVFNNIVYVYFNILQKYFTLLKAHLKIDIYLICAQIYTSAHACVLSLKSNSMFYDFMWKCFENK
jgi:predicted N-acyltransferase